MVVIAIIGYYAIKNGGITLNSIYPTTSSSPTITSIPATSPSSSPSAGCVNPFGISPEYLAKGSISILVVPTYFSDTGQEITNHNKRLSIYNDSFKEINHYIEKTKSTLSVNSDFKLSFELSSPISVDKDPNQTQNRQTIREVISTKLNRNDLQEFDILVMRAYTSINTGTSGYNYGDTIWLNQSLDHPLPENISLIENNDQDALHNYRGALTSTLLHEILHSFGMSDNCLGCRQHVFYDGNIFDGTQKLYYIDSGSDLRHTTETRGIFQQINQAVASEIGWQDTNKNNVIDVNEACQR